LRHWNSDYLKIRILDRDAMWKYITFLTFFVPLAVFAQSPQSRLYFETPSAEVSPDSEIVIRVLVDSNVPLNAFETSLSYSADILELMEIQDSRSIINVWQTRPTLEKAGKISFAGGSVKAFKGSGGELLSLRFKTLKIGEASLVYENARAYIADGRGTVANSSSEMLKVSVKSGAVRLVSETVPDQTAPSVESLKIFEDPLNPTQKLISFEVRDLESGVKNTQARLRTLFFWSNWFDAQNPIAISKEVWAVQIMVHDNSGNFATETIYNWSIFLKNILAPLLIALVVIAVVSLFIFKHYLTAARNNKTANNSKQ